MRIVLVDREPIVVKTIASFLSDLGHEVKSYRSVAEFLQAKLDAPKSVQVIMSSFDEELVAEGVREIHRRFPASAIVLMLDEYYPISHAPDLARGVYGCISKPVRLGELELMLMRIGELHTTVQDS